MKISHELPIDLLPYSYKWNDFDYCLPKFLNIPEYKEYFIQARKDGRFIILDNGLFEGETYNEKQLFNFIEEIKPDIFIVPDSWNNKNKTLNNAIRWKNIESSLPYPSKLMVVIQSESLDEAIELYDYLVNTLQYDHIAFNHSLDMYNNLFPHKNKLVSQMMGRMMLINHLDKFHLLQDKVYHHLLGCSLPQEFAYYQGYSFINSVDTSNPIMNGIYGIRYEEEGLFTKPFLKIESVLEKNNLPRFEDIIFNVKKFRKFCI